MMESESDADLALRSFDEYDENNDCLIHIDTTDEKKCDIKNPYNILLNDVLQHRAANNTSFKSASDFARILNSMPGAEIEIPSHKKKIKKEANLKYEFILYIVCTKCKHLIPNVETKCPKCGLVKKKTKNNCFVYIPLIQQIKFYMLKYAKEIYQFLKTNECGDYIRDFYDGLVYKNIKSKNSFSSNTNILPFTLNVDGGKIFSKSSASLWPIQLIQLYLPPNIRYLEKNLLVVGLYCGFEKPDLPSIIHPLADEIISKELSVNFPAEIIHFTPVILFAACDIPARSQLQNCKCSGYFGCPVCEHPGILVKNENSKKSYVRFLLETEPAPMRTHENTVKIGYDICMTGLNNKTNKGIKSISCMIGFRHFNLINGFIIDYMHGCAEGVMKLLIEIWMGKRTLIYNENEKKKKYEFKAVSVKARTELINRLMNLKPYDRISHKPRGIEQLAFFSANEYRSLMWYYLKFALYNILPSELINHFELFSAATYMLSKTHVSKQEIKKAAEMLDTLCDDFEKYYGANSITLKVHLLRHYATMVVNCGPLWTHSLFCFESKMGKIKRMKKTCVDVVETIAFWIHF